MKNIFRISGIIYLLLSILCFYSCKKEIPTVTTSAITNISESTATCDGTVTDDGSRTIILRGVCWSTSPMPTVKNSQAYDESYTTGGTGMGSFTCIITGLATNTTYFARAFAINNAGTGYGNEISFTTLILSDIDGNVYQVVTIGTQVWMVENLKTTKYRNGDIIGTTIPATLDISSENQPEYQWVYDGNEINVDSYGRLYTWYAATDSGKICPTGWHVPSDAEWDTLIDYLGGALVAGCYLKEAGKEHWDSEIGNNASGFTALPGGMRLTDGIFYAIGWLGNWWSVTEVDTTIARARNLSSDEYVAFTAEYPKGLGVSIRCVKD